MANAPKKVRFFLKWNLIFSFCLAACSEHANKNEAVSILWSDGKAEGVFVPRKFLSTTSRDSVELLLRVHLANNKTPMLGEHNVVDSGIHFIPSIPLTPGLKYDVYWSDKLIGELSVPIDNDDATTLMAVYPGGDTLPENLLK